MVSAVVVKGYPVVLVWSVPQTIDPFASVSRSPVQLVSVCILMPPVTAVIPANDEVADAPRAVTETLCEKVEVPVVLVASMELV